MATYRWRIPLLAAVQFNGENHEEVKELLGDDSPGEEFLVGTGEYEEPEAEEAEAAPKKKKAKRGKHTEEAWGEEHKEEEGAVTSEDLPPPEGEGVIPYNPKRKPKAGPKEKRESLAITEGDWVTKDAATGKVEVNPEGFPEKYEFVSG